MELGERIRSLRKQKGLTQEELASRLCRSQRLPNMRMDA